MPGPAAPLAHADLASVRIKKQAAGRLWTAKLTVPALPAQYVERPRLRAQLDAAASRPVVVVSAPPGAGKTVMVSDWVARGRPPGPTVWLSLDARDQAAGALWPLLVAGLRRHGLDIRQPPPLVARDTAFLASLANHLTAYPRRFVLVLDCDATLPEEDAMALDYVISHAERRLALVVLSRTDPMLPLHRYRLRGELAEIRMSDLAFSADEAGDLLMRRNVRLQPTTLDFVMRKTQGWAAGLAMLAMDLESSVDVEVAARDFTGDGGTVADYLLAEVLEKQSPEIRTLLLDTSVADVLLPGLVESLAGRQGLRALAELEHRNAFLTRIPGPATGFRYHPLFRELLRAVLAYESPRRALGLHRTAARWLAKQGMLDNAIMHALAAKAWDDVADLVVDALAVAQVIVESPNSGLRHLLSRLPLDATGASAAIIRAACAVSPPAQEPSVVAELLAAARSEVSQLQGPRRAAADLAVNVVTLAAAAAVRDDGVVLETASALEGQLAYADPDRVNDHPELRALLGSAKGAALVRGGDLEAAKDAFAWGSAAGGRVGCEGPLVDCLGQLGLVAAWRGNLREAADWARDSRRAGGTPRGPGVSPSAVADVVMAWVCADRCDVAGARRWLVSAASLPTPPGGPLVSPMLALVRARICRAQGDIDRGLELLEDALGPGSPTPHWLQVRLRLEHARLNLGRGQPGRAFDQAAALVSSGDPFARLVCVEAALATGAKLARDPKLALPRDACLDVRVDACLLEARWQLGQGDEARAVEAVQQALRLAARERMRRPFREGPREVRQLLRRHRELTARHHWLSGKPITAARIPAQQSRSEPAADSNVELILKPLTPKEQEVLGHLSELLTTEEIASAMFVSANTVRTHVRNILRKLAASRRNEAVRRARELHLLSN